MIVLHRKAAPMLDTLLTLDPESLVLTANRRLSRTLTRLLDQQRCADGATVWPTPSILPLAVWLEQCWAQRLDQREVHPSPPRSPPLTLLTPWQERLLWEKIIAASATGGTLLRVAEAAKNAQKAWNLLQEWQLTLTEADLCDQEDATAFYAWSNQFASLCRKRGWLERARLPIILSQHLRQPEHGGWLQRPKRLILAGFQPRSDGTLHTPNLELLFAELRRAGCIIETKNLEKPVGQATRMRCASREAEWMGAALWARNTLSRQGDRRIGIVVPNLEKWLPQVVDHFTRTLYPGSNPNHLDPRGKTFNVSLGAPLLEVPMIHTAMLLLRLGQGTLSLTHYSTLLHAPFWHGGQSEFSARSLLDSRLRRQGVLEIRLNALRRAASRGDREAPPCPLLATTLASFMTLLAESDRENPTEEEREGLRGRTPPLPPSHPSQWIERFSRWLSHLGWPGESPLNSGEYQLITAWQEALARFATLDKVSGPLPLSEALTLLERILAESTFQPAADEAPIQIMGLLEAVGESCDDLWITGLAAEEWPPPLAPNPFLPIAWQRRHGLPQTSFAQEAAYHEGLFQGVMRSAEQIVCSFASRVDEQPQHPTACIAALPDHPGDAGDDGTPWLDYNRIQWDAARIQRHPDAHGPPYPTTQGSSVGAGVLQSQALCPFQAFARFRLGAESRPEPIPGLDASQRGQIVHAALTQLWQHLKEEALPLHTLPSTDNPLVQAAVRKSLEQAAQRWPEPLHPFFRQLEDARLNRLLEAFLELEKERAVPFTVIEQERERLLTLGGLPLRLRMDRLDRLPDDSLVILDYKTGAARPADWFGERPRDPQLPLYLLAQTEAGAQNVAALAFCQLQAGACRFSGLSSREGVLPQMESLQNHAPEGLDWRGMIDQWRVVLTALGERFVGGEAQVDPLPAACRYCELPPLCRHHEQHPSPVGEEEESP
ncbi:MAG: PD-(D/E)XK nuclease family protein [Magnetococcales bacterium]|nr:PD-(D/E)XK nuclease family protein [Magnetococcales bacterium]